jgi:hypothetical protein
MAQGTASGLVQVSGSLLEELLTDMRVLVANMGGTFPDAAGRMRVSIENTGGNLFGPNNQGIPVTPTAWGIGASQVLGVISNLAQEGGQPANTNVGSLMNIASYNALRPGIVVS